MHLGALVTGQDPPSYGSPLVSWDRTIGSRALARRQFEPIASLVASRGRGADVRRPGAGGRGSGGLFAGSRGARPENYPQLKAEILSWNAVHFMWSTSYVLAPFHSTR